MSGLPFDPEKVAEAARANAAREPVLAINGHDAEGVVLPPEFSDDALGLRFSHEFGPALRYVAKWSRWFAWDGKVWREDSTLRVYDLVRQTCRALSGEAKGQLRAQLTNGRTVASVEKLVRSDRRHAAMVDQWDADPWLLNTPGGIVDLRTTEMAPHHPDYHMTKMTAVTPSQHSDCPIWFAFLDTVTAGDKPLQGYLQRVFGYGLTGSIREHAMFFAYGTGGNGKGTCLNTIQSILADYARDSPSETFTARTGQAHLTELARLMGARIVVSQETEEGKQWAEARVKAITGGDPITANFMRQDHFTFNPQFKLIISGNHKPQLRNVDDAMRRRFNLIPFTVKIAPENRDPALIDKLRPEWPAILRWMIDGCRLWLRDGLMPPKAVMEATAEYFEGEDALALWLAECCTNAKSDWEGAGALFRSWDKWAKAAGEFVGSQKRFSQSLISRGYVADKRDGGRCFNGIALIPPPRSHHDHD